MNTTEVLQEYEDHSSPSRPRALGENEIIVNAWTHICRTLEDRASLASTSRTKASKMRLAAREIRLILKHRKSFEDRGLVPENKIKSMLKYSKKELTEASIACYYCAREVVEQMVLHRDHLAQQAAAGHVYKKRINTVVKRLDNILPILTRNVEGLRTT